MATEAMLMAEVTGARADRDEVATIVTASAAMRLLSDIAEGQALAPCLAAGCEQKALKL